MKIQFSRNAEIKITYAGRTSFSRDAIAEMTIPRPSRTIYRRSELAAYQLKEGRAANFIFDKFCLNFVIFMVLAWGDSMVKSSFPVLRLSK